MRNLLLGYLAWVISTVGTVFVFEAVGYEPRSSRATCLACDLVLPGRCHCAPCHCDVCHEYAVAHIDYGYPLPQPAAPSVSKETDGHDPYQQKSARHART